MLIAIQRRVFGPEAIYRILDHRIVLVHLINSPNPVFPGICGDLRERHATTFLGAWNTAFEREKYTLKIVGTRIATDSPRIAFFAPFG